jgi:hypothetical protein
MTETLATRIAAFTESPNFIAFNAHCFGAAFSMAWAAHFGFHLLPTVILGVALAAGKEFWWDLNYETAPPQTWRDSALDFLGYLCGIAIGAYMLHWRIFP